MTLPTIYATPPFIQSGAGDPVTTNPTAPSQVGGLYFDTSGTTGLWMSPDGTFWLQLGGVGVLGANGLTWAADGGMVLSSLNNASAYIEASHGLLVHLVNAGTIDALISLINNDTGSGAIVQLSGPSDIVLFTGSGSPVGAIAAINIGDIFFDGATPAVWQASSADDAGWVRVNADVFATLDDPAFTSGISTAPTDSHTATTGFGALAVGTPKQNTLGYDVLVNVSIPVSAVTGGSVNAGVGPTAAPTLDAVSPTLVLGDGASSIISFSVYVPAGYYLSIAASGTITLGTPVALVTPV